MNYYEFMEVPENAGTDEINRAYRRLALRYHPDKREQDDTMFRVLQDVRTALTDPATRARYNRTMEPVVADGVPDIVAIKRRAAAQQRAQMLRDYRWFRADGGHYELEHMPTRTVVQRLSRAQVDQIDVPTTSGGRKMPSIAVLRARLERATEFFLQTQSPHAEDAADSSSTVPAACSGGE